jgi:SAM-dependent methyltransferase
MPVQAMPADDDDDDDGQYPPASLAPEDLAEDAHEDLPDEASEGIDQPDSNDGHRPGMKDGHDEPDDSGPIEAIPEYQEDRPPVLTRAITQEMLATSVPDAETDASVEDEEPHQEPSVQERGRSNANAAKTIKMTALPFEDMDSMRARPDARTDDHAGAGGAGDDEDGVDVPIEEDEPAPTASPQRRPRASTMALSDDDLEELLEPSEVADNRGGIVAARAVRSLTSPSALAGASRPSFLHRGDEPSTVHDEDGASDQGDDVAAPAVDEVAGDPEADLPPASALGFSSAAEERSEQRDEVDEAAVAMDAPARAGSEAPVELADSSDSGEILEDDMIEEVNEPAAAASLPDPQAVAPPVPPPAPPKSAPIKVATKTPPPAPKSSIESATSKGRSRKGKLWFEEIFDEDYLRTLPFLTPQATQAEALFVADALGTEPGARLLDIGCGYGRHAMELAARGYQIVALDLSLPLLLRGADEAQRRGLTINFIHGDMRDLAFDSQFDGIYCLFSTFGYFDEDTNRKTIEGMARAMKPGARLVLDVLNRDYLIGELPTRVWWEGDGCVVLEEVDFNYFSSRVHSNRSIVFDDGRQIEQEISIRSYSLHELGKLLHAAGLRVVEVSGSMATHGRFFGNQSRSLIVVAEKRERAKTATAPGTEPLEYAEEDDDVGVDVPDL